MPSNEFKDSVQEVLTLTSKTDINLTFPPDVPCPTQAVLLCTYYITIPEKGVPKASEDVKFLTGDYETIPQGKWKHTYNLKHTTIHESDEKKSDGIIFPAAELGGGTSLGDDSVESTPVLDTKEHEGAAKNTLTTDQTRREKAVDMLEDTVFRSL